MIKERILQIIDFKKLKKEDFFKKIGMTSANFRGNAKNTPLNSNAIENILSEMPEISPEWLLTGEGDMLRKTEKQVIEVTGGSNAGIPLIPIEAVADFAGIDNAGIRYEDCERYFIPEFERIGAEFVIRVSGSSMYPKYSNGDLLACRKIYDILFFQWGKVYVIDSSQGQLVKRIFENENSDFITLVSDNKEKYPPFPMPKSDIRSLHIVLGVVRLE